MKFSRKTTFAKRSTECDEEYVIYNWDNGESVSVFDKKHPVYTFISSGFWPEEISKEHEDDINYLIEHGILIENETIFERHDSHENKLRVDRLHLVLLPAGEACNLECVYCYEDHADKSRMGDSHVSRIVEICKKNLDLPVHIDYFGGEPLLNIKFIKSLSEALSKENIKFTASITTNGTLITDNVFEDIYHSGIKSFQITLDGNDYLHNKLRPSRNKKHNSFEKVMSCLKVIQSSNYEDISVIVRTNVNEDMLDIEYVKQYLISIEKVIPKDDPRFTFFPKPIGDYSSSNFRPTPQQQFYCAHKNIESTLGLVENALDASGYRLADGLFMATDGGYSCYAGKSNSYVITPDFLVRKCTVAFNDPINIVGKLNPDGTIEKNENFLSWIKDWKDDGCFSCFLENSCTGNSCPLVNIKASKKCCPPVKKNPDAATLKIVNFVEKTGV